MVEYSTSGGGLSLPLRLSGARGPRKRLTCEPDEKAALGLLQAVVANHGPRFLQRPKQAADPRSGWGTTAGTAASRDQPDHCTRPGPGLNPEESLGVRDCLEDRLSVQIESGLRT